MNIFKKMALVASMTLAGMTCAHANGTYLQMDSGGKGDFENSWTFDTADFAENGVKGASFGDYFQFNIPDDEYVSFSLFGSGVTFNPGKSSDFYGFVLYGLGLDPFEVDEKEGATAHSIEGGEYLLTTGTYEIDVYGQFTKADGTYGVNIFGTPAIPEPTDWALMLAGLGAMGVLARRRKQG